jgi:hypothetical protein
MRISHYNQMVFKQHLVSMAVAFVLSSCGRKHPEGKDSLLNDFTIGATPIGMAVELGEGYSGKTGNFLHSQCVKGTTEEVNLPLTGGEVKFLFDAGYNEIIDSLSGAVDGSLNLTAVRASAGARLAKNIAKTTLTTNLFSYVNLIGKARRLKSEGRSYGPDALQPGINSEKYCGTDFVSQIDYGASMAVSLEITAKTEKHKEKVSGYLKVNVQNLVEVDGELEKLDEREAESYSVRLMVKQIGGLSQNITLAIPDDGFYCTIKNIGSCIDKMNATIRYMKGQMRSDLSNVGNWNPMNYHTISYKNTAELSRLAPVQLTDQQKLMLENAHDSIKTRYEETMSDWKDAKTLKEFGLSREESQEINTVISAITFNANALDRAINGCMEDYTFCMQIASDESVLNLRSYNRDFRQIGFARLARNYCASIIAQSITRGIISAELGRDLTLEETVPVFEDQNDLSSGHVGIEPCFGVYESLINR